MDIHYILLPWFILTFTGHCTSSPSRVNSLPIYNPSTRCHDLTLSDENLTFAICLQRASNKQHPFNLYTSPTFCSTNYPPSGHLIDLSVLSNSTISRLFDSLIALLNSRNSHIDYPEPNFLWISSNFTQNLTDQSHWCPQSCQTSNSSGKFRILRVRCPAANNSKPCLTSKNTHWDRAPFICLMNQTYEQTKSSTISPPIYLAPTYPNNTIVFFDSTPCVIVRTTTHQYSFCFRRQSCLQSQTSAFCSSRIEASEICRREKNESNLLTIENDDEYQLINDVITSYSNQTLLDNKGLIKNQYIQRAQWMWIDGLRSSESFYGWEIHEDHLTEIDEKYWCTNQSNCLGGKGRDHVVLNIICQNKEKLARVCLASRRQSEPGPFICKRTLKGNESPVANYTLLRNTVSQLDPPVVIPVYEKNLTSIYYDEDHCLTVQSRTHLYTLCLRRQECFPRKAYCTKWSQAQKNCQELKNHSQLLTIDNEDERTLITDIVENYHYETRLTYNGSSYRYFLLADFIWIDGVQQADNRTYLWKNGLETIPEHLWCSKNECNSIGRPRVMLNLLCHRNSSLMCLASRLEWKPAPYICKRVRPIDVCPILFEEVRIIKWNEMLIVTVNRTVALIKCKHPEYNTEIKVQYQCNMQTKQWKLIYKNDNFTCPDEEYPSTIVPMERSPSTTKSTTQLSTPPSYIVPTTPSAMQGRDCFPSDLIRIINDLPTRSRYIYSQRTPFSSASYYDVRLICHYNPSIQITYRCDVFTRQYIYVYGNSQNFRQCVPRCTDDERRNLLNKYFTSYQQRDIQATFTNNDNSIRFSCFDSNAYQWKSIEYQCGTMTITKDQWYQIHSCSQSSLTTTTMTTTTVALPTVMVSMSVTQEYNPSCPPAVIRGSPCEYQPGEYIVDRFGCTRKICPSLSQLCQTIRCPPDRICRVILCRSCAYTDYLQAVCEHPKEPTLCDFERQISILNDFESIARWEQQTLALVRRYANEKRQRLRSPWPVLTINYN